MPKHKKYRRSYILVCINITICVATTISLKRFKRSDETNLMQTQPEPGLALHCRWVKFTSRHGNLQTNNSDVLFASFTANIWEKTEIMLDSLLTSKTNFKMLIIDDFSTDGTYETLRQCGIWVVRPDRENLGVSNLWNLAFTIFAASNFQILIMANNDVIVPSTAIEQLIGTLNDPECYLAIPMSTESGKGAWPSESIEHIYNLTTISQDFFNDPKNYECVQAFLKPMKNHQYGHGDMDVRKLKNHFNPGFLGFFFAITKQSFGKMSLGNAGFLSTTGEHKNVHQEMDIASRIYKMGGKICLNPKSFVFHFKGSTRRGLGW